MKAIGHTPLLKLERLSEPGCADIYVKYEGANPTGSMKDRMALSMVEGAEKKGRLQPGGTVGRMYGQLFSVRERLEPERRLLRLFRIQA